MSSGLEAMGEAIKEREGKDTRAGTRGVRSLKQLKSSAARRRVMQVEVSRSTVAKMKAGFMRWLPQQRERRD